MSRSRFTAPLHSSLGVEVRGGGRRPRQPVVGRVGGDEGLDRLRAVGVQAVPDDDEGLADPPAEVAQGDEDVLAVDAAADVAGGHPAPGRRGGRPGRRRWRPPARRRRRSRTGGRPMGAQVVPGPAPAGAPRLVHEGDRPPGAANAPLYIRSGRGGPEAPRPVAGRRRASSPPFGVTDTKRRPRLPPVGVRSMAEQLRRPRPPGAGRAPMSKVTAPGRPGRPGPRSVRPARPGGREEAARCWIRRCGASSGSTSPSAVTWCVRWTPPPAPCARRRSRSRRRPRGTPGWAPGWPNGARRPSCSSAWRRRAVCGSRCTTP